MEWNSNYYVLSFTRVLVWLVESLSRFVSWIVWSRTFCVRKLKSELIIDLKIISHFRKGHLILFMLKHYSIRLVHFSTSMYLDIGFFESIGSQIRTLFPLRVFAPKINTHLTHNAFVFSGFHESWLYRILHLLHSVNSVSHHFILLKRRKFIIMT